MKYKFSQCLGRRIRILSRIVDAKFRLMLKEYNVSESQLSIMFFMYMKKNVEQGIIGKAMRLERSSVSRNIDLLVKKGFIEKSTDYHPMLSITPKGIQIVEELKPKWDAIMDEIVGQIGEEGYNAVSQLESKLL